MSYCRFSSDNWKSDVYVYLALGDVWTTHVAANRIVGDIPQEPSFNEPITDDWMDRHQDVMDFLRAAKRAPIGLPLDGMTFHDTDLPSIIRRLSMLREMGYHVPDSALAALNEELADYDPD